MSDLLNPAQRELLIDRLIEVFATVQDLRAWLRQHFAAALPHLADGSLVQELARLFSWASSEDGLRSLLQHLADRPPAANLPDIIMALSINEIRPRQRAPAGLAQPPHQSLLAADRPFVNRVLLRQKLAVFTQAPPGPRRILVIDGDERSGKSFAVSLALGCQAAPAVPTAPIDINDFAGSGVSVDALELAGLIVGDQEGAPAYDPTKEEEAVPRLVAWMGRRLLGQERWVVIDHCNRAVLTRGAHHLILALAGKLHSGAFTSVRLLLVDFDPGELPAAQRPQVLHDRAALPDEGHVAEWCRQFAASERRRHEAADPAQWAREIFAAAASGNRADGSWHIEFERQLNLARERILACEEVP